MSKHKTFQPNYVDLMQWDQRMDTLVMKGVFADKHPDYEDVVDILEYMFISNFGWWLINTVDCVNTPFAETVEDWWCIVPKWAGKI